MLRDAQLEATVKNHLTGRGACKNGQHFSMSDRATNEDLRFVTIPDPNTAVGLAVRFMLDQPVYADIPFGRWAGALNGQVNRGHYGFVLNQQDQVVGFIGWALATEEKADAWVNGEAALSDEDCREGNCVIFNSFIANSKTVHDFIWDAVLEASIDKVALYFRRAYTDGRVRPVRIPINQFVRKRVTRADPSRAVDDPHRDDEVIVLSSDI